MSDMDPTRAQRLGTLIKEAREHAQRSVADCAQVLNVKPEEFKQVEQGEFPISLPDLEALTIYLKVPMGYFWGTEELSEEFSQSDFDSLIELRQRVIGVLLRQLRLKEKSTQKALAESLGVDNKVIRDYETGKVSVPYLHLEQLGSELGVSIDYFLDGQRGPLGKHESEEKLRRQFNQLSPELQAFLLNPVNVGYIETAWRLSEMEVTKLRTIAESLLDITL